MWFIFYLFIVVGVADFGPVVSKDQVNLKAQFTGTGLTERDFDKTNTRTNINKAAYMKDFTDSKVQRDTYPGSGLERCDLSEEAFFNCVKALLNKVDPISITLSDLTTFFNDPATYKANMNAEIVMNAGDYNHDGVLDMNDWNHENRTLFYKDYNSKLFSCFFCRQNGIPMILP